MEQGGARRLGNPPPPGGDTLARSTWLLSQWRPQGEHPSLGKGTPGGPRAPSSGGPHRGVHLGHKHRLKQQVGFPQTGCRVQTVPLPRFSPLHPVRPPYLALHTLTVLPGSVFPAQAPHQPSLPNPSWILGASQAPCHPRDPVSPFLHRGAARCGPGDWDWALWLLLLLLWAAAWREPPGQGSS